MRKYFARLQRRPCRTRVRRDVRGVTDKEIVTAPRPTFPA